uniref:Uncharacterized protein n=1 Tax=Vespula pensylvanica TaxID=30213 RepID=A0A834NRK5_VESPE|nr:hypothetical protein H0235_011176 [Vespula pensylvanica]
MARVGWKEKEEKEKRNEEEKEEEEEEEEMEVEEEEEEEGLLRRGKKTIFIVLKDFAVCDSDSGIGLTEAAPTSTCLQPTPFRSISTCSVRRVRAQSTLLHYVFVYNVGGSNSDSGSGGGGSGGGDGGGGDGGGGSVDGDGGGDGGGCEELYIRSNAYLIVACMNSESRSTRGYEPDPS